MIKQKLLRFFTVSALSASGACGIAGQAADSGALWLPYFLEGDEVLPTYGASVAVDREGGIHAAYAIYTGEFQKKQPAFYAYCPGGYSERANWSFVRLGEAVQDCRLALDPEGRPRLILFGPAGDPEEPSRMRYQYAQCNAGWTDAANWTLTTVSTPIESAATRELNNNRYFAISPQGTLAFLHWRRIDYYHDGLVLTSCSGDGTNARNWTETLLTSDNTDRPSLAFSPDGRPRLLFGLFDNADLYLAYAQSDSDWTDPGQWSAVILAKIHGSTSYSLQTDSQGRPHAAFSAGSFAAAPFDSGQLYYLWCTEGSATDAANWHFVNVGAGFSAGGVDLALDAQGRPRITYEAAQGLAYAWSDQKAQWDDAVWQHKIVESNDSLEANYEVLPINKCTRSRWSNGQRSCLALDANGNARIAYDAEHAWSGVYADRPWENCGFKDVTIARLAFFSVDPFLSIRRKPGSVLEIVFRNGVLESASALDGPWSEITGAVSPYPLSSNADCKFYRVRP